MRTQITRIVLAAFLTYSATVAQAGSPNVEKTLEMLQKNLSQARALPPGERPLPPKVDLAALVGTSRGRVVKALSSPSFCEPEGSTDCTRSNTWSYLWGPPAPDPQSDDGYVTVTTGGPWLLVVEFSGGLVSAARWLGQR
jgi:hypothetical protein